MVKVLVRGLLGIGLALLASATVVGGFARDRYSPSSSAHVRFAVAEAALGVGITLAGIGLATVLAALARRGHDRSHLSAVWLGSLGLLSWSLLEIVGEGLYDSRHGWDGLLSLGANPPTPDRIDLLSHVGALAGIVLAVGAAIAKAKTRPVPGERERAA